MAETQIRKTILRLVNWRQPAVVTTDDYQDYFLAGCRKAAIGKQGQLVRPSMTAGKHVSTSSSTEPTSSQYSSWEGIVDNKGGLAADS